MCNSERIADVKPLRRGAHVSHTPAPTVRQLRVYVHICIARHTG